MPEDSTADRHPTILFIHGLGADENDLIGLAQFFDPRFMCISVRAPFTLDYGGYSWYDFLEAGRPEPKMFQQSSSMLSTFLDDVIKHYPVDTLRLFIFGFSMGTVMSLAMSLTRPEIFRGIVANSGYLADNTHLNYRWNEIKAMQYFVAHGTFDPLIPVDASRIIKQRLEEAHAAVEYHEYPMQHEISDAGIRDIDAWLRQRLKA